LCLPSFLCKESDKLCSDKLLCKTFIHHPCIKATMSTIPQPTFQGHVATTNDALILFEACLRGQIRQTRKRPHGAERHQLIRSGSVFIYQDNTGIERWTDGLKWSPSRILGNFFVYREMNKPFPRGRSAVKKKKKRRPREPYPRPDSTGEAYSPTTPQSTSSTATPTLSDAERQLIRSWNNSYDLKPNGLVKKTMNVTVQGVSYRLVSYYNMDNVKGGLLELPSQSAALSCIRPRLELKQSFNAPLEEMDENLDGTKEGHQDMSGDYLPLGYQDFFPDSGTYHPQHGRQQGVSAGYLVGPSMGGNFMPQMAPSPREGEYVGFNHSPGSYDSLHGNLPPSSSSINPTLPSGFSERPAPQTHHPGMYSQVNMQPWVMTALSTEDRDSTIDYVFGKSPCPRWLADQAYWAGFMATFVAS
jgi:Gti1/Pac2 family transcription factor